MSIFVLIAFSGCGGGGGQEQVLRIGFLGEGADWDQAWNGPVSGILDPGWNVSDPLVKLDDKLRVVPSLAERWELSADGRTLTFHLRHDGRWTNGEPLTAADYAYGWKRTLTNEPGLAYFFTGIVGADAFAHCDQQKSDCESLWRKVGIKARDDYTLEVRFTSRRPFFVSLVAASKGGFTPLNRANVERYGEDAFKFAHLVTSGPFKVKAWVPGESLTLVKDKNWRGADEVGLDRIEVGFYRTEQAEKRALEAGALDVFFPSTIEDAPYIKDMPADNTAYAGLNLTRVPDPLQRRAMALTIDRRKVNEQLLGGHMRPATSLTNDALPGFERIESHFLTAGSRLAEAKRLLRQVKEPVHEITLWTNDSPLPRAAAPLVQEAWEKLGLDVTVKVVESKQYFQLLLHGRADAYIATWIDDYPEAFSFLEQWRCTAQLNLATHYCDAAYDRLLDKMLATQDEAARIDLYAKAESMLTGPEGAMPVIPLVWGIHQVAVRPSVENLEWDPMGDVDLTKVQIGAKPRSSTSTTAK